MAICRAVWCAKTCIVGITATPKPLEKLGVPLLPIPIDRTNLHHYAEGQVIPYASLPAILADIKPGQRGGIYIKHVQSLIKAGDYLRERGHNPLMLWSLNYEKVPLSKEQLNAREYLITHEAVPDVYDIFLFNATAETSINIRPSVNWDFFIAHNTDETTITQSRGRYRADINTLYVYDKKGAIIVPEKYLNRTLGLDELKELRDKLELKKDRKGHALSIDDMLKRFNDCGYNCEAGYSNRRKTMKIIKA